MRLVLLPGFDGTGELFRWFVDAWDGPCTVVAYPGEQDLDFAGHLAWVRQRLPRTGEYLLVAESFSGPIGATLAAERPEGLMGLVLVATFAEQPLPVPALAVRMGARLAFRLPAPVSVLAGLLSGGDRQVALAAKLAMGGCRTSALVARADALAGVDGRQALSAVQVPVLSLRASRDRLVPARTGRVLKEHVALTEVAIDGPHLLLQTRPGPCVRAIEGWWNARRPR